MSVGTGKTIQDFSLLAAIRLFMCWLPQAVRSEEESRFE